MGDQANAPAAPRWHQPRAWDPCQGVRKDRRLGGRATFPDQPSNPFWAPVVTGSDQASRVA